MKSCPKCDRLYDDSLSFCLEDGAALLPVGPDADAETVFRNADPQPRRSNLWKYAFLILVPLLLAGFVAALFISQKINGSRELGGTQNAPGNSANTALVNTATNANANKENQNV